MLAAGSAILMKYGVVKMVSTETATMIGYMRGSSTPRLMPSEAMMNENSPICVSVNPLSMATRRFWPVTSIPSVPNNIMPVITTAASSRISHQYSASTVGSTIMPTEMKKTEPKRFLTGVMTFSILSATTVPAKMEPITKAPSSSENPHATLNMAIAKQRPMATTSIVSSLR